MALVENDPSARIQLRRIGELQLPASCYVCGSGNCDAGYLDFGTFVDYHGSFYLCLTCAKQAAEVMGYYSPEEVTSMVQAGNLALEENELITAELEKARERLNAFDSIMQSVGISAGNVDVLTVPEPEPVSEPDVPVTDGSASGESKPKKSVKGTGRKHTDGSIARHFATE